MRILLLAGSLRGNIAKNDCWSPDRVSFKARDSALNMSVLW